MLVKNKQHYQHRPVYIGLLHVILDHMSIKKVTFWLGSITILLILCDSNASACGTYLERPVAVLTRIFSKVDVLGPVEGILQEGKFNKQSELD